MACWRSLAGICLDAVLIYISMSELFSIFDLLESWAEYRAHDNLDTPTGVVMCTIGSPYNAYAMDS